MRIRDWGKFITVIRTGFQNYLVGNMYHYDLLKENSAAVYAKNLSIGGPIIDFNDGRKNVNEGSLRFK